jgi:hypothetical protein
MAVYQIYQFDDAALPLYNPEQQLSPPAAPSALVASIGGQFDYAGGRRELAQAHEISVRGIYAAPETAYLVDHAGNQIVDHASNDIIVATALGYLRYQMQALTDKIGCQGTLWRRRWDDETVAQWKTARLRTVRQSHDYKRRLYLAEIEAAFESSMVGWRAATAVTVSGTLVTNGRVGLRIDGGGDVQIDDAVLTIAATGAITSLTIAATDAGIELVYAGTLASGQTLTIDAGARTVKRGTANHYQYFSLGAKHTADGWLPLARGVTPLVIYSDGPGTATVRYYHQFL